MAFNCISLALLSYLILLPSLSPFSYAIDTLKPGQPLQDGKTLISAGEKFELGFFSPGKSSNRYVGIWYHNFSVSTVLWVANRESPVRDRSGSLAIGDDGNLVVLDGTKSIIWSSNTSTATNNSLVQLMDNGNLVLNHSGSVAWQSFDHPTDTYMPGMKAGLDLRTHVNQKLTSWTSEDDPAPGNFSLGMDPSESTQIFMWDGQKPRWRSGRWNGQVFIGVQNMVPTYVYGFRLSNFEQEQKMYFYYNEFNSSHRYVLTWDGIEKHLIWRNDTNDWYQFWAQPVTECEIYNKCGKYGSCTDGAAPICSCLRGFVPASSEEWSKGNWSSGCIRRTPLGCGRGNNSEEAGGDGFWRLGGVKLPDISDWKEDGVDINGCEDRCLGNCSCTAYAYVSGIGCLIWGVDLLDIHIFSSGGNDLYLRLAGSELDKKSNKTFIIIIVPLAVALSLGCIYLLWKCKNRIKELFKQRLAGERGLVDSTRVKERLTDHSDSIGKRIGDEGNDGKCPELSVWSFDSVVAATKSFSNSNFIGEGGFGPVYKGILPEGEEIAVKRLSRTSMQGLDELKNEVMLIAKLQHRNLVRLLGCCIQEDEKILIYEYMPNSSLDAFLFDPIKTGLLDWKARYNIIEGIARGLLYLHRDSRLRVIHRDLKASNILLDEEMNPKISDFGMARIFGNDDNETNTKRVVGTFGYMSPEYAMQGIFSVKSDVYSFGILLLEIVGGKKNSTYRHPELATNLIAFAWKLWNEDRAMEFVDPIISDSCSRRQVSRCINVGLLCVQDRPNDRPTMASVVMMLGSETANHPPPRRPTFTVESSYSETDSSTIDLNIMSANASITIVDGR
ncbi:G-type lectin S-receptor-like serine/threonine-protein kinase B120 [Cocos nucifera]|uniref:Receptor-like serine/threonine-protein kinase n=1 Tax=Cocos nucifera TaxID=13894 RepID=A0A8K0N336_COCNU|nr:G-type lectin S-receptor-like serine/threonine-protein kinase B120 [Cocos nucifera]